MLRVSKQDIAIKLIYSEYISDALIVRVLTLLVEVLHHHHQSTDMSNAPKISHQTSPTLRFLKFSPRKQ
jgi:hypothetical protein